MAQGRRVGTLPRRPPFNSPIDRIAITGTFRVWSFSYDSSSALLHCWQAMVGDLRDALRQPDGPHFCASGLFRNANEAHRASGTRFSTRRKRPPQMKTPLKLVDYQRHYLTRHFAIASNPTHLNHYLATQESPVRANSQAAIAQLLNSGAGAPRTCFDPPRSTLFRLDLDRYLHVQNRGSSRDGARQQLAG